MNLKQYINQFDFTHPRWDNLPMGFPHCDTSGLTQKQDRHLYNAIKTEWIVEGSGRQYFYKLIARRALVTVAIIFTLLAGRNIITKTQTNTNTVSAKTVGQTVGEIIESTRSALIRRYD